MQALRSTKVDKLKTTNPNNYFFIFSLVFSLVFYNGIFSKCSFGGMICVSLQRRLWFFNALMNFCMNKMRVVARNFLNVLTTIVMSSNIVSSGLEYFYGNGMDPAITRKLFLQQLHLFYQYFSHQPFQISSSNFIRKNWYKNFLNQCKPHKRKILNYTQTI